MDRSEAREAVFQVAIAKLEGLGEEDWLDEYDSEDWPLLLYEMDKLVERIQEMSE